MRRFIAALAAGLLAGVGIAALSPASSEPVDGVSVPSVQAFNALDARVTELEARVDALEVAPTPTPTPEPSPTPTPTPEPTPTPTPDPEPAGFPDASNTGVPAGTTLTDYTGPSTISTDGTVIDGKRIGCLTVNANNVVIRNSKITCNAAYAALEIPDRNGPTTRVLIVDTEIDCLDGGTGIGEAHFTARRLNIHDCDNGFDVNQDALVEDSFIHDLDNSNDSHADGVQLSWHWDGTAYVCCAVDVTIRHNTIFSVDDANGSLGTSAIISNSRSNDVLVEGNLLGGGAYTLYCPYVGGNDTYRVVDNRFTTQFSAKVGAFGASDSCSDEFLSGNVYHETGAPIALD